jgi:NarL family two-component system response regulator LiaR
MKDTSTIHVMIVDDQAVVRSGLKTFLLAYDDLELVAEAADGEAAVRLCGQFHPDVILMDVMMPRMDGITAMRTIRKRYPQIQVLILTGFKEANLVQDAFEAGAIGYLIKNITAEELAQAIHAAYQGAPTIDPEVKPTFIHIATHAAEPVVRDDLTPREREVLQLLVQGLMNAEIADTLVVSQSTVKFHVSNIIAKLHAINRTEAVAKAIQNHFMPPQL